MSHCFGDYCMVPGKQVESVVGHVGIEVSHLERSRKFYKSLFSGLV